MDPHCEALTRGPHLAAESSIFAFYESRRGRALWHPKGSNGVRRSAGNAARAVIEVGACGLLHVMRAGHAVLTMQVSHIN